MTGELTDQVTANDLFDVLRAYQEDGVVFESSVRGRRYRVASVRGATADIERVDGGATEAVTGDAFQRVATEVREAGSLPLDDVPGNRVQGATIAQSRSIGLSTDRRHLLDIRDDQAALTFFAEHIRSLRVDRAGGVPKPYKPVILDVVFRAIVNGALTENRIAFDWLLPRFERRMEELGFEGDASKAAYAYANLAGDVIWLLAYRPDASVLDTSSPSPAQVQDRISHAQLKDRLWSLLRDPEYGPELIRIVEREWFETTPASEDMELREAFERVLSEYEQAKTEQFGGDHPMWGLFERIAGKLRAYPFLEVDHSLTVRGSVGAGNWAHVPWVAITGPGHSIGDGVYCVYLFRADMTGVHATLNQGVTAPIKAHGTVEGRKVLRERAESLRRFCDGLEEHGFALDNGIDLRVQGGIARNYEASTVAHRLYQRGAVPDDAELEKDLAALVDAYKRYLESGMTKSRSEEESSEAPATDFVLSEGIESVIDFVESRGFVFEPWHIAQYVTAVRTKPFVILAGITGTGKSKLPALVAEATGSERQLIPVRPDWTDSSDVLGYTDLQGVFRPGRVLEVVRDAVEQNDRHWVCIIDEMNLARVEQYFAEVLSHIEDRTPREGGGFGSRGLLGQALSAADEEWTQLHLPPNLALVGTVNMDESAHGFSRKVLDRAFTLELSDVELSQWRTPPDRDPAKPTTWPTSAWHPRATMLGRLQGLDAEEVSEVEDVIGQLVQMNRFLRRAQLQIGYRSRDEIVLFVLHAQDIQAAFRDRAGDPVDPFDLAIQMKVLPRITGGSNSVRQLLGEFLGWAHDGKPRSNEDETREVVELWESGGREEALAGSRLPRTTARLALMWQRLELEGFTSFWL